MYEADHSLFIGEWIRASSSSGSKGLIHLPAPRIAPRILDFYTEQQAQLAISFDVTQAPMDPSVPGSDAPEDESSGIRRLPYSYDFFVAEH